jgi:hypothetical protein
LSHPITFFCQKINVIVGNKRWLKTAKNKSKPSKIAYFRWFTTSFWWFFSVENELDSCSAN